MVPTRLSNYFLRTLREDPSDAEVASHRLLVRAGYIRRQAPGVFAWLPIGLRVKAKIEQIIRDEMTAAGAHEVHFPALLPREPYEVTGRWIEYGEGLFRLQDRKGADYLLAPTHEEVFTLLVKDLYSSYKDLPLSIYQIQDKYRDEARPRAGLLRGREFTMKDAYSFDYTDAGLDASYQAQRDAYERIFARLGLEYVIVKADAGAMGGSKSEEFLHPSHVGEDTFVRSAGGYAANVEAFTTIVPAPIPFDGLPEPAIFDSPNTPTIATLVGLANAEYPRPDGRDWTAADTLKNVVLALTHLDGTREVIVIGIPGDREIEPKRVGVAFAPADVEAATDAGFREAPGAREGLHRPVVARWRRCSARSRPPASATSSTRASPTAPSGSRAPTSTRSTCSALVAGRDFTADGVVEAADVREGDPAPDGSGPVHLARGVEIGHVFQLGRKYADALGLKVLDENGKLGDRHDGLVRHRRHAHPRDHRRAATTTTRASSGPRRSPRSTCTCSPPARMKPSSTPPRRSAPGSRPRVRCAVRRPPEGLARG